MKLNNLEETNNNMLKLELTKEEVEALNHMLKVEINSYKTDELETEEFNTLIQFAKKVRNTESNTQPSEAMQWASIADIPGHLL